jgi:hypothetical protein
MGIKEGDEVITTTYAPAPVPTGILLAGGVPVFSDIEEDTCSMDASSVAGRISPKTRCILAVHIFGYICDIEALYSMARPRGIIVIEDAAQAHGSVYRERKAGSLGDVSCSSFYPTKNLGAYGDGGIVLTDDPKTADTIRLLRNYGKKSNPFDSDILGYNSRLDELQAAILRVKLRHLDDMNENRRKLVLLYKQGLDGLPLAFLKEREASLPNYHILTVLCPKRREALIRYLEGKGVQTNIYYPQPLHKMKAFRQYRRDGDKFPVSEKVSREAIALPLYPELSRKTVTYIIDMINKFFGR